MNATDRSLTLRALAGLTAVFFAGCGGGFEMMPSPLAYRVASFDPFENLRPEEEKTTIEVLYATDREPVATAGEASAAYTDRRGLSLRFGAATVNMGGESASWPDLERQSLSLKRRPRMTVTAVNEVGKLWTTIPISDGDEFIAAADSTSASDPVRAASNEFAAEVNRRLKTTGKKNVVVYVPGFNTSFETPILMMAQFGHFMQNDAVFIAFSWPSTASPFGYDKQISRRAVSIRNLRQLLIFLAEDTVAERIHLVTYSAGAPVVTDALLQLRLIHAGNTEAQLKRELKIGHVIYAGADQDLDYFRNVFLDQFDDVADSITVYTSSDDSGLGLSSKLMNGTPRLGRALKHLTPGDQEALRQGTVTSFIDATDAKKFAGSGDMLAHSYWYLNPWVNTDVIAILVADLKPGERGLVRDKEEAIWSFPEDYPKRIEVLVNERREAREKRR